MMVWWGSPVVRSRLATVRAPVAAAAVAAAAAAAAAAADNDDDDEDDVGNLAPSCDVSTVCGGLVANRPARTRCWTDACVSGP